MSETETDVTIVGAGPTGLFAAYYAGFRGKRVTLVDALPQPGGQVSAMYPEKEILDVAGFPAVRGRELVDRLVAQADRFAPTYVLGERAAELDRAGDGLVLRTSGGRTIRTRAVVVAAGIGHSAPRPMSPAPGIVAGDIAHFVPDP
ncbi:NAD(P)/FAD-dependent oxidoreductase, partial [Pseudonocardia pini]|uniref:NAD(P)/FAD-dependent oxidoreductase n=1 Tax=Pseudonocardia pini TaxID=2758030 RepID=UPI0015F005A1